jgi:sugar phosphate isomerase/epimerase
MYAQQRRFADGAVFARYAAALGFDAIEISHWTPEEQAWEIAESGILPITSIHAPAPYRLLKGGILNASLNLAAPDEDARRAAVDEARRSIDLANEVHATAVVVHLGRVGDAAFEEEGTLTRLIQADSGDADRIEALRQRLVERRAREAGPYLEAARWSLRELVIAAERFGIAIGVENRVRYDEIPLPDEYPALLDGFDPEQAGFWYDTGHGEVLHRLGLVDLGQWLGGTPGPCIGAHIDDVAGVIDHFAPGDGDIDWPALAPLLGHLDRLTLEINQKQPDASIARAREVLRAAGLVRDPV